MYRMNQQILNVAPSDYPERQFPAHQYGEVEEEENGRGGEDEEEEQEEYDMEQQQENYIEQEGAYEEELEEEDQSQQQQEQQGHSNEQPYGIQQSQIRNDDKIKQVANLQNYLVNSYEQKIQSLRSTSLQNKQDQSDYKSNGSMQRGRPALMVTSELQKVLSPSEIRELAECLTSKSVNDLYSSSRNYGSFRQENDNSFQRQRVVVSDHQNEKVNQPMKNLSLNGSYSEYIKASHQNSQFEAPQKSRSLSANRTQLKLFEYSLVKKQRQELLTNYINQQSQGQANQRKISKKSNQLLTQQIENQLNSALDSVDHMQARSISFSQMGRVLYLMGVFNYLIYDENFKIVSQGQTSPKQMETRRKFAEMQENIFIKYFKVNLFKRCFHEELWQVCSLDNEEQETIMNEIVYCILRILMDPVSLGQKDTIELIKEYLVRYQESEQEFILEDKKFQLQLKKVVSLWKELNIDKFAYKAIGFLKMRHIEDLTVAQQQNMTFHPKIEKTSELFELHSTANFLQRYPIDGAISELYEQKQRELEDEYGISDNNGNNNRGLTPEGSQNLSQQQQQIDRYKLLYKKQEITEEKVRKLRQEKELKEMEMCTFKPDLSINSKINECSMLSKYNGNVNIFQRLSQTELREDRLRRENMNEIQKLEEQLLECTFTPALNYQRVSGINEKMDAKDLVHDFEKNVGRMKNGYQKAQILKEKLEQVSKGEKYDTIKKQKQNPPSLLTRKIQKKLPFTQLRVYLNKNKIVTISLKEDDNPKIFARNFAKTHQISPEMEQNLQEIVSDFLLKNSQKNK